MVFGNRLIYQFGAVLFMMLGVRFAVPRSEIWIRCPITSTSAKQRKMTDPETKNKRRMYPLDARLSGINQFIFCRFK